MNGPDIGPVEQRLAAVISKERRAAISYTVLTVLCTPVFVLVASFVALIMVVHIVRVAHYDIDARGIYTGTNLFLAGMLIFVLRGSGPPEEPHAFDRTWLAAVIVFILPLVLTYATSLPERTPVLFGVVYGVLGFVVLGLLGRVHMEQPPADDIDGAGTFSSLILPLCGFVAMAYGEVTRSSWLWFPPKPDELRVAAWLLCKLAIERTTPPEAHSVPRRILNMLTRLKLVQERERKLRLTLKGQDLVTAGSEVENVVKE